MNSGVSLIKKRVFKKSVGFTLVEVLVALGIFAMLSTGYLVVTGDAVRGLGQIQDKIFALWIAEDIMVRLRTYEADQHRRQFSSQDIEFLDRSWVVRFKTEATEVQSLMRVTLNVSLLDNPEDSLAQLETYFYDGPFVPQN